MSGHTDYDEVLPVTEAGGVAHRELAVLEVHDAAELTALLNDQRLADLVLARIGSTAAVVDPRLLPRLTTALLKAGHTPTILDGS